MTVTVAFPIAFLQAVGVVAILVFIAKASVQNMPTTVSVLMQPFELSVTSQT